MYCILVVEVVVVEAAVVVVIVVVVVVEIERPFCFAQCSTFYMAFWLFA